MDKRTYVVKRTLAQRGSVESLPSMEVKPFLVAEHPFICYDANESSYGGDNCALYPAWVEGNRAWMLCMSWCAAYGYCASGTEERMLTFEEGVQIILERGIFEFDAPTPETAPALP